MFNVVSWVADMRAAVAVKDAEWLAKLMYENDKNGVFSYANVCNEFGEMSREKWEESTIKCAESVLDDMPNHTEIKGE